uniref:Zinc finger CCCH domain-containing protein 14 n=1 Tax=Nomascus leucogenys TaxID=61853 RepID=A0A2I3GI81_NOMLE
MRMSSKFPSPPLPIFLPLEPVDLGSITSSSCSLNELDNIAHLLRKISTDINEIKGMKAAILTVEANLLDLNVRVSQNEAKISSLEVKMNEYSAISECNRQFEDQEEDTESQSRTTDVKIIGFLRNVEKAEMSELSMAQKPEKLLERCKYWPACKNGDECAYHHPISPCKAFPNCKFAEKCLFVHPNCKYDAKCTKPDCPFTHVSRRIPVLSPKPAVAPPASPSSSQLCRYFPACKKMECPFYHPKHCRFNTQCTRPDCTFYHPTINVPPRHALKWIRPQTSE